MRSYLRDMKGVFKFAAILFSLMVGVVFVAVGNAAVAAPEGDNSVMTTPKVVNSAPFIDKPFFDRPVFDRPFFRPAFNPFFRPAFNPFINPFFDADVDAGFVGAEFD
jgi:hypothetical protein